MQKIIRLKAGGVHPAAVGVAAAAAELAAGGLALIPTETVYGVGVSVRAFAGPDPALAPMPAAGTGYRRIFSLKQRSLEQTVAWLVAGEGDLDVYGVDVPPMVRELASAFWPGALTLIVRASDAVPPFMRAADGTVALRASSSPVVAALVRACGSPLAVTSANTHGMPAPASFSQVEDRILAGVDVAVDAGATTCRDASTIVAPGTAGTLRVLRAGALPLHELAAVAPLEDGFGRPIAADTTDKEVS